MTNLRVKWPADRSTAPAPGFEDSRDYVQSLARGLAVLRAFDGDHATLTLAAIAARTGLSRAAARRLVLTLQHLGYVRTLGREYSLSPRVLELGFGCMDSLRLTELVQPLVERLAQRVNHSCSMAVLDGQSIVYVLRVPVRRVMTVALGVGARLPAFAASMGRVLLSGLSDADLATWLLQCQTGAPHAAHRDRSEAPAAHRRGRAQPGALLRRAGARARPLLARRAGARS